MLSAIQMTPFLGMHYSSRRGMQNSSTTKSVFLVLTWKGQARYYFCSQVLGFEKGSEVFYLEKKGYIFTTATFCLYPCPSCFIGLLGLSLYLY